MNIRFRHTARAVILDEGQLLVARMIGAHSFLPGGGVELGESAHTSLQRELLEELGITHCTVIRFLGVVETSFTEPDGSQMLHEISHLFEVTSDELQAGHNPVSRESHLEFYWADATVDSLRAHNVLPTPVQTYLPEVLTSGIPRFVTTIAKA